MRRHFGVKSKKAAKRWSQLYARALEAHVKDPSGEEITQRLNDVYAKVSSKLEPASEAISLEVLRREKW